VVLFGVVVFFGYAYSALLGWRGTPGALRWGFMAWLFAVMAVYFGWFWSEGRRTLPMRTMAVRLVDRHERPLSRGRALLRYLACWAMLLAPAALASQGSPLWLLALPLPFLWGLRDPLARTLYDRVAGTRLVLDTSPRP
jgi:uncharacterized RDD family membrane protein YckC